MSATTPSEAAPLAKPAAPTGKDGRRRNYSIDFMRVVLFSCVVMVHAVGTINYGPDIDRQMAGLSMLMHYTRYGFVFITVFVLFLGYYHRDTKATTFWRRRFGLVVLPYLLWSIIYSVWEPLVRSADPWPGWQAVAYDTVLQIVKGDAKYHLYFLLISMQIYLLFPALRWLVRKTTGHHGKLLCGAIAIQLAAMLWVTVLPGPQHPALVLLHQHVWKLFPMYVLFAAMGALAAVHFDRAHSWVTRNWVLMLPVILLGFGISTGVYLYRSGQGVAPHLAASAQHPSMLAWAVVSIIALYLVASAWNERRGDGRGLVGRAVDLGAIRAFGVYAAHPILIDVLHRVGFGSWLFETFPNSTLVRSSLLVLATFAITLVVVEVLLRSPLSKLLVARPRQPIRKRQEPEPARG
ncbi:MULTISPECIES: acyltransferase [Actinoalloteichus]|uniref:Surface polysaccharide O-acyltransferase, integral membrane enzyme n=1 Tax=Actinoalloteichus caeruleus DSM 43889 TaxID=1120930 RepID=A0ABT1JIK3_ACTCY|nr:acyltransferase [Actinoalloteichus caeruleus]MCP2332340.1 Surface polysaccharide O-acyltransferase, integral membrane enzyme [Actinoalloteichus caeruleus DSM 43889]